MSPEEFLALQAKYASGNCSPDEERQLKEHWADFQLLDIPWSQEMGNEQKVKRKLLKTLHQELEGPGRKKAGSAIFYAAAAVLLVTLFVVLFNQQQDKVPALAVKHNLQGESVIQPGSNKAILTLSNGSSIDLDDSKNGLVSNQGSVTAGKAADGKLVYKGHIAAGQEVIFNTITTPRGGQYQVVLADGTKVWLNAASSLKFPASFTGKERRVTLTGEAYFEVAKNRHMPFRIAVNNMGIEVLGTHFNVNAYPDEDAVKTTLIEGAVKLSNGNHQAVLKPGQQGLLGKGVDFDVRAVNVDEAIAWKNGYFIFDNENIQSIMRKVSRWYDVDVSYQGKIDEGNFGGTVSRFNSVAGLLKSLELTGTVHFKTEERRIIVMP